MPEWGGVGWWPVIELAGVGRQRDSRGWPKIEIAGGPGRQVSWTDRKAAGWEMFVVSVSAFSAILGEIETGYVSRTHIG